MESFGSFENRFVAAGILSSLLLCSHALHGVEVASSQPCSFGLDTNPCADTVDGTVLFDFETEAEGVSVRCSNPGYGSCVSITNGVAASGDFALRIVGAGDAEDAKTGYLPRLLLRPTVTDWREYDRLVIEVTSFRDSGANGRLRLFLCGPDGMYDRGVWLGLPLKESGYRQWVVPLNAKWSRLGNVSRLFFSFESFLDGCDIVIDRIMLLRKGSKTPSASSRFVECVILPQMAATCDELIASNSFLSAELGHLKDYVRFCGETSRSAFRSHRMAIGVATSMEKVRPRADVVAHAIPDEGLSVRLARNEYESIQIAVASFGGALKGVKVSPDGDLRSDFCCFSASNIACEVVGYINVTNSSKCASGYNVKVQEAPGYKRRIRKAETGWWPDPILSFTDTADVSGTDVQTFWVRVHCPEGQPEGLYHGALVVSAEDAQSVRVPFAVRVNGFSLGRVSELPLMVDCKPMADGNWAVAKIPDSPYHIWKRHREEWCDFLADYLISWDCIYSDAEVPFDLLERLRSQGRLGHRFCLGYIHGPTATNDSDVAIWRTRLGKHFSKMRTAYNEAKARGLLDRAYIYGWDEKPINTFPAIRIAIEEMKSRFPGVPVSTTAGDGNLAELEKLGGMDWFIPNSWRYRKERAEESRKAGHQVWWYICDGPRAPYANWFIECQAIEARLLMGAMAQRMKPDGFLYYRTARWRSPRCIENGPFTDWLVHPGKEGVANGDGYLTYVGPDGVPLPSIRLENFRDGLEDYAYAKLLAEKLGEVESSFSKATEDKSSENWMRRAKAALAVPREVMDTMTNFTDDPAALYLWRDEMADLIEESEKFYPTSTAKPQRKE